MLESGTKIGRDGIRSDYYTRAATAGAAEEAAPPRKERKPALTGS